MRGVPIGLAITAGLVSALAFHFFTTAKAVAAGSASHGGATAAELVDYQTSLQLSGFAMLGAIVLLCSACIAAVLLRPMPGSS